MSISYALEQGTPSIEPLHVDSGVKGRSSRGSEEGSNALRLNNLQTGSNVGAGLSSWTAEFSSEYEGGVFKQVDCPARMQDG